MAVFTHRKQCFVLSLPHSPRDSRPDIIYTERNTATTQSISISSYIDIKMPVYAHTCTHISQQLEFSVGNWDKLCWQGKNICAQGANLTVWQPTKRVCWLLCAVQRLNTRNIIKQQATGAEIKLMTSSCRDAHYPCACLSCYPEKWREQWLNLAGLLQIQG